jgi:XTP/dITP diphosphohydrolase
VIYLASQNAHKATELGRLLGAGVAPLVGYEAPVEDGLTFADNARIKARAGAAVAPPGATVVADDSGIVVEALGGAPGIHSARYGGPGLDDAGRVRHLLHELGDAGDRRAAFVCVLVAVLPDGSELVAEGRVDGTIALVAAGEAGFGYDPVFVPDAADGTPGDRTFAQMTPAEKHAISHRGRALQAVCAALGIGGRP